MPQNGFHGLVGLATSKAVGKAVPAAGATAWVTGIVLGAMGPDIDMYPTAIAVLLGRGDLTYVIHRSATHSLITAAVLLLLGLAIRGRSLRWGFGCMGLALGIVTHGVLDTLFWFAPIDLLWPLRQLFPKAGIPMIHLWQGAHLSPLFLNIREAFEFAAFAFLLLTISRIASKRGADVNGLNKWQFVLWIFFGFSLVTAFIFRENDRLQNYVVTTPYLLAFLPYCWLQVWKFRRQLTDWARA